MRNSQGDVDAFIDETDGSIEEVQPRRHRRVRIHEGIKYGTQHDLTRENRRRQRKRTARRRSLTGRHDVRFL